MFDSLILNHAIPEPAARLFWGSCFLRRTPNDLVPFPELLAAFCAHFRLAAPIAENDLRAQVCDCASLYVSQFHSLLSFFFLLSVCVLLLRTSGTRCHWRSLVGMRVSLLPLAKARCRRCVTFSARAGFMVTSHRLKVERREKRTDCELLTVVGISGDAILGRARKPGSYLLRYADLRESEGDERWDQSQKTMLSI